MAVTIKDIARSAGVSTATVSRVLNDSKFVSPDLRQRVMQVIRETGYKPNALARGLIKKQTQLIGVILPDLANQNFARLIEGVENVAKKNNFAIIVSNSHGKIRDELEILDVFREKQIDGIIFSGVRFAEEHKEFFERYRVPTVMVGQTFPELDVPSVNINNFQAAYDVTRYLIELGHERIAMITGPMYDRSAGRDRYWGFSAALKESGLTEHGSYVQQGDFDIASGYEAMRRILAGGGSHPTAVFAASDRMAVGALNCCLDFGLRIPEDISIVGFDGNEISLAVRPTLTTLVQDHSEIGAVAARLLIERLQGRVEEDSVRTIQVAYKLEKRQSTGPPPALAGGKLQ